MSIDFYKKDMVLMILPVIVIDFKWKELDIGWLFWCIEIGF